MAVQKERMTITEALAEVSLTEKKLNKSGEMIQGNLVRAAHAKDVYEGEGGAAKAVSAKLQSMRDLFARHERIRRSIAEANLSHEITVGEDKKSIFEWLTWKREVATKQIEFLSMLTRTVKQQLDAASMRPTTYQDGEGKMKVVEVVSNIDLPGTLLRVEKLTEQLERLDGLLSLKNATIVIEF